ncbi:hypothetical protein AAHA92_00172 [Salvia divinorum]|uniref:H15 domain-containing protein n=1 Tax=Salvia divinorum TaxID=28513 RepID=A0ABD1IIP5_SALDI
MSSLQLCPPKIGSQNLAKEEEMQQRLTRVHNANQPMINLQNFVLALAQARPIPPSAETLIRDRLHRFISDYRTPDHPTYSHMIENALDVLNEKGGSSQKSISQYLEKNYDNLPWAHVGLLKHHLQKACQEGQVIVSRRNKYRLARDVDSSTKDSKKPRQTKWKWECEAEKPHQLKIRLITKRDDQRGEAVKKCDEKEEAVKENVEHQTKTWVSCVDGEKSFHTNFPSILQDGIIAAADEKKYSEEEDGHCSIAKADIQTPEHRGRDYEQPEPSTPERPPGFESLRVENIHESDVVDVIIGYEESELAAVLQSEPDMMTIDSSEFALSIEQEQPPLQKEEISQGKQLRRSLRTRPARPPQVAQDIAKLPPEDCPEGRPVTVCRRRRLLLKQSPRSRPPPKATSVDKPQDSPKSQNQIMPLLLQQGPVKNVDGCKEEEFEQSGSTQLLQDNPKAHLHKALKEQHLGRPPTRRSARLVNQT